ncbi:hypothetical protein [Salmonirosea aquatica]|uniref:Helix-turn-helix domain-containing protein n=1 Tax=Salmonirosea aquatica TaxID=2654236 RepID=A0A7C9FZZ3_9BACT|nr:hypothetical protein [Cytophagaceae bacterium SJW1-29]
MENHSRRILTEGAAEVPRDIARKRVKEFGFERVAEEAGLKAYQTVMRYCEGKKVRPTTEALIISALEKLEADRIRHSRKINGNANDGFQVVPLSQFNELQQRVEKLSDQLGLLMKSQLAAHQWVSSEKAAIILNCSAITLHRRKQAGELEYKMQGSRVAYSIESLMDYLAKKHFKTDVIQQRVMSALAFE